jgi:hypothetical protein
MGFEEEGVSHVEEEEDTVITFTQYKSAQQKCVLILCADCIYLD